VNALDSGDLPRLETLLNDHPFLARYRCRVGAMYEQGYFAGATLLYHVAGNPDRGPLPEKSSTSHAFWSAVISIPKPRNTP
jgi:hypothetical protein